MLDNASDFLDKAGPKTRTLFLLVLLLIEVLPLFIIGSPRRMSSLNPDDRERFLQKLDASFLAALIALPKAILGLVYFEHPDVEQEIGYDATPLVRIPAKDMSHESH